MKMLHVIFGGMACAFGFTWGAYRYGGMEGLFNGIFVIFFWLVILAVWLIIRFIKRRYKIVKRLEIK